MTRCTRWSWPTVLLVLIALMSGLVVPAWAQHAITPWYELQNTTGTGNGGEIDIEGYNSVGIVVEMSSTGTVALQAKGSGGTYKDLACTDLSDNTGQMVVVVSESKILQCNTAGMLHVQTPITANDGTILVKAMATTAVARRGGAGGGSSGDTLASVTARGNSSTGNDETNPFQILGTGAQAGYGIEILQTSAGDGILRCLTPLGPDACNYRRKTLATYDWGHIKHDGTPIWITDNDTGRVKYGTIHCDDANVVCQSYRRLPGCGGDFVGIDPATGTAAHIWNKSPLATAPTAVAITGTNVNRAVLRFPDSDGTYGVQIRCRLPANVTIGQVDGVLTWISAGTGNYRPQILTKCYADNASPDAAFNAAQIFTVAAGTATNPQIDTLSNITMTGCSAGNILTIEVERMRTEASDTGSSTFDAESFELWAYLTE